MSQVTLSEKVGLEFPNVLLPKKNIDMQKYACVACDQYTSEPEYWQAVEKLVGEEPSTLRLMLPEVYLDHETPEQLEKRQDEITKAMKEYVAEHFEEHKRTPILVTRDIKGKQRLGLMMALDLEAYDFSKGSTSLVRATEKTIVERLPPRVAIRKEAVVELPHILVLIDDPERTVLEPLQTKIAECEKLYDFELMQDGGKIAGYKLSEEICEGIFKSLDRLADPEVFEKKYGCPAGTAPLVYGVGDGNHSLATAKTLWEEMKARTPAPPMDHPARYALVELENVHDDANEFEPIHRLYFDVPDVEALLEYLVEYWNKNGEDAVRMDKESFDKLPEDKNRHVVEFISETSGYLVINKPKAVLDVATLQVPMDLWMSEHSTVRVDFVHGTEVIHKLKSKVNIGFVLPSMDKNALFKTCIFEGVLPRKTFSMGEAHEKRFYLEARSIVQ